MNFQGFTLSFAFDLHEDVEVVKSVINDFDLFVLHEKEFGSSSIEKRLERNRLYWQKVYFSK